MKQILLSLFLVVFGFINAQVELIPNPSNINSGTFTFKYGKFNDFTIFDPQSNPNLYLYTGLQTDADPATWDYNDGDFTIANLVNMIPLTLDTNLGYYVATFNPATRNYFEEVSQSVVSLPNGLQVFDWYFLITTDDLSRQSADLRGSDYGFGGATLSTNEFQNQQDFKIINQTLYFNTSGEYLVSIYNVLGKQIINKKINVVNNFEYKPKLRSKGLYIVKVNKGNSTRTLKMLNY